MGYRPVSTAVITCFITGTVFLILGRFIPTTSQASSSSKRVDIPLAEQFELSSRSSLSSLSSPILRDTEESTPSLSRYWWKFGGLVATLCLRVETFRRVSLNTECVPSGYTYAIPFAISIYDYCRNQRTRPEDDYVSHLRYQSRPIQAAYSACRRSFHYLTRSKYRGILAAILLSLSGYSAASFYAGGRSTYICPIIHHGATQLRGLRLLNVLLDSILLIGVAELYQNDGCLESNRRKRAFFSLGVGLVAVSLLWLVIGFFVSNSLPEFIGQPFMDLRYSRSAFSQATLAMLLAFAAWQLLPQFGILGLSILGGFVFLYFSTTSILLMEQMPLPYISAAHAVFPLIGSTIAAVLYLLSRVVSDEESKALFRTNILLQVIAVALCFFALCAALTKHHFSHTHPIDILIHEGNIQYEDYLSRASTSETLEDAVSEYRKRYQQHPPPGFDKWYEFATSRSSLVIDEFDQIYKNLLPFRALSPAAIREATHKLATNPFNDLGAVSIRNGKPKVQEGIKPTHAWMVKGAAQMIEKFSQHLPDMDVVFNLNDEPRVAVPWEKALTLKREAKSQEMTPEEELVNAWSPDRQAGWDPVDPADQTNETIFTDGAWHGVFDRYVSVVCPPSSKARRERIWNRHDLCFDCVAPHSMGQFPIDFNLASDVCHQPDLAYLHGLLISPASFKISQELIPVFSQSALAGFNDILFPSPWNYMDKVKYTPSDEFPDPEYHEKRNSLYWVGSTSEGYSQFDEWKGIPRQRFAHLINNNTDNQVSVLLPVDEGSYKYEIMDGAAPISELQLQANVHIADPITRCGDCDNQFNELGTISWVDFQNHWSHRFLFDLDGAGFSGRFLPFLQSRSLPFRTGLFRQWFDSRMISWLHFVPVDVRLHGLWSTLSYFSGVPGAPAGGQDPANAQPMRMKPHTRQGKWIADQGRKWAGRALRKEDMEIYFFRLLLEWGRLTDDQRDVLGYQPPG
ncbi:hypothetical protein VI817_005120 [Penicillium citrinum]|nr:hypothetical protein VI817_005120 [Penicillium citrinum]